MNAHLKRLTSFLLIFLSYNLHFLQAIPHLTPTTKVRTKSVPVESDELVSSINAYYSAYSTFGPYSQAAHWNPNFNPSSHFIPHPLIPLRGLPHHPTLSPHPPPFSNLPNLPPPIHAPNPITHPTDLDSIIQTFLDEHNRIRSNYGVPHLKWNPALVPSAKRVTDTCTFKHTASNPYGENIAAGQTSPQQVVSQWVDGPEEKSAYDPQNPRDSHFTQVVWEESQEFACAYTSCTHLIGASLPQSPILFWACEYNPPGNVDTLYAKNVHAAAGGSPLKK